MSQLEIFQINNPFIIIKIDQHMKKNKKKNMNIDNLQLEWTLNLLTQIILVAVFLLCCNHLVFKMFGVHPQCWYNTHLIIARVDQ